MPWLDEAESERPPRGNRAVSAVRVIVRGRVQGVGFRWWTVSLAGRYGVSGFVGNRPDGAVEVFAEAPENRLSLFVSELNAGPPLARVESVDAVPASPRGLRDFSVVR